MSKLKQFLLYGSFLWIPMFAWYTIIPLAVAVSFAAPDGYGEVPWVVVAWVVIGAISTITIVIINMRRK